MLLLGIEGELVEKHGSERSSAEDAIRACWQIAGLAFCGKAPGNWRLDLLATAVAVRK